MNKIFSISIILSSFVMTASAQERWTMDRCISYAVQHAATVTQAQITADQKCADSRLARLSFLPTVNAGVSAQYQWGRNIDPETNTYDNVTTFNNYYNIEASLVLFDGGQTLRAFQAAKMGRDHALTALEKSRDDKAIDIMTKFVDAVYAHQLIALNEEKLSDSKALLHKTRRLYELGNKSLPDVTQLESQVTTDTFNLLHQRNAYRTALMVLQTAMNYPLSDTLLLDEATADTAALILRDRADDLQGGNVNVRLAELNARQAQLALKDRRAQLLPKLSLAGGVYTNYYRNFSRPSSETPTFRSQLDNNLGEYVGVSLTIPLFSVTSRRNVRQARADRDLAVSQWEESRRQWRDGISQAILDRDGYYSEVRQMRVKVKADSVAYHLNRRKYEEGMLSTFDLHTSAETLLESRIKLLQTQLLFTLKQKLVNYYKGEPLWTLK